MSETVLEHRLVREYLHALDSACAALPAVQARELREQIIAHLDEALPPGASDAEVTAELGKLGAPPTLAAEAAGPGPRSGARRLGRRLSRVRWWTWAIIGTALAAITAGVVYLTLAETAEPLGQGDLSAWWFPQDRARQVYTEAAGVTQTTVLERYGQEQGFVVGISNDSDWTQTIVGLDLDQWASDLMQPRLAVGSDSNIDGGGTWGSHTTWDMPGSIPPHSVRLLRVLWISHLCNSPGAQTIFQDISIRVRVGPVTRTEDLNLGQAWALQGTKASACGSNG